MDMISEMYAGAPWGGNLTGGSVGAEVPEGLSEFMESAWGTTEDVWSRAKRDAEVRDREKQERLKAAEVLHHVWLYDDEADSRAAVDAADKYSYYVSGRARLDDRMLPIYGRDYAEVVMPNVADDPWACIEAQLDAEEDEERKAKYRAEFEALKVKGGDTANDYYGLYGRMVRDGVRGRYAAFKAKEAAVQVSLGKMNRYVAGEDVMEVGAEGAEDGFTDEDLANARSIADPKMLEDAEAVRAFMRTYVKPLGKKDDAEEILHSLSQLEDELFECIGEDVQRAEMVREALLDFAEGVKKSNKVGPWDEFVVAVGKKLQDWGDVRTRSLFSTQGAVGAAGAMNMGALHSAAGQIQSAAVESKERHAARSALRAAINKSLEVDKSESMWKGSLRALFMMAGDTLPYLVPGVGMGLGTADVAVRGITETADMYKLNGLTDEQAGGQAFIDTAVQAGVELLPFSRVGGKGLSAFVRSRFGAGLAKGKVGALSRWAVRQTQKSLPRAMAAEWGAAMIDEAVLEPVAGGFLQYGVERVFDFLEFEHGQTKEFAACFEELKQVWEPQQLAGLALFTAGLTGVSTRSINENVRYFAAKRVMWEAEGLKPGQVDELMAIKDMDERVEKGRKLVDDCWENDAAGMAARMAKQNAAIKERGEVLVMTGEGAVDPAVENSELAPAYRAAWNEYVEKGLLPKVEAQKDGQFKLTHKGKEYVMSAAHADAYLEHAIAEAEKVMLAEARTAEERKGVNLRAEIGRAVSLMAGNAALRAVAKSEQSGIEVQDLVAGLPESLAAPILAKGYATLEDAKAISEWALGQIRALVEGGASDFDARMTRPEADGMARSLGEWSTFATDFATRERVEGLKPGEGAISVGRYRGQKAVQFNGREVMGQVIMGVSGRVSHYGAVEDITESVTDMMLQQRAAVLVEQGAAGSLAEGEAMALEELADVVRRAREVVLKADPDAAISEVKEGKDFRMSVMEALSTMARAKFLGSGVVPKWMESLTSGLKGILGVGAAVESVRAAYAEVLRKEPNALAELEGMLSEMGVHVQDAMREARIEAVDIQAWKAASAIVGARAAGPMGAGGAAVSDAVQEAERTEQEIVEAEGKQDVLPVKSAAEVAAEEKERLDAMVPGSNAPAAMQGVFVDDKCYYNEAGGFWCGMIAKEKLSDGTEQVKVGAKGKHGVIQGKELTGNFQQNVGAIYVWKRKDGSLQVISGRHRYAKLMEDAGAKYCNCYVFEEDAEHDEKWARMLDYENNMRDDQADEVTAATYVRETGLPDEVLKERGLLRNHSRSKRGVFIGRHARQELWTRFVNGAVKPKDAEIICELTRSVKAEERIDEIQGKCCMLLDTGKSWEYIGGMVQLMASKEAQMKQGLLDFGADFMEDLTRAAEWIEKCVHKVDAAIKMLRNGRKMSGEMREEALRLGVQTETDADSEEVLRDLQMLRKKFELIGSYPDLVAQAQMWDGKSEVDPVGYYLENARKERIEAQLEGEMTAEEYLEEQARKAAAESVPALFTMEMTRKQDLTLNNEHVTQSEAWAHLEELAGKPLHNRQLDKEADEGKKRVFVAYINKPQRKELTNIGKALVSSTNGFSVDAHYAAVNRIEKLFENAVYCGEYPDLKHGEETVHIHRFACPMMIDGEKAVAWLTAKQTMNVEGSERLYNLELEDIEKLAGTLEYLASHRLDTALPSASKDILAQIEEAFKSYFEEVPDFSTFSANMDSAKAAGMFRDGHLVAGNAVVTEPGVSFSIEALQASPHRFRKFSTDKMGSGEGHQAYGWGLYFAENEKEGNKLLASRRKLLKVNKQNRKAEKDASYIALWDSNIELMQDSIEIVKSMIAAGLFAQKTAFNYRVELNVDDSNLLMWDDTLLVSSLPLELQKYINSKMEMYAYASGEEFYRELSRWEKGAKQASELLLAHGIKGIKYLDGASRGKGEGSYNYVIFSGDDVKITGVNESGKFKSMWEDYTDTTATFSMERNLAAVHSLSAEKFLGALELGGMPLPSVAVTRLDKPYSWGGANGIALVGRPELVDPRRGTDVYSADAWTGKFPRVVHKHIESADFKEAAKAAGKLEDKYGYVFYELANMLRQADTRSDLEYLLSTDTGKALFACMQGYEPKAKTVEKPMDYQFLDKQFAKDTRNMWENGDAIKEGQELAFADAVEASLERWLAAHKDAKMHELYRNLYSDLLSDLRSGRPYGVWFKLKMSLNNMGKRELDAHGNREMLAKYADKHKKAFAAWVQEKVDKWRSKEGYIRENGKEATLDNVVSYMLSKKGLNNEEFMGFSPGKLRAALSAKMRSLDDIKARREQLGDSAESKESKEPSDQLMMEYCRFVREHLQEADADSFYAMDYGLESLSLVKGKPTEEKMARAVRKVFSYTKAGDAMAQDEELLLKGVEAVESVRREVEDYMEAVPQRAVKMDEWEYAVMPLELKKNKAVMAGLRENGIKPRFHDGTEEGRKAALAGLVNDSKVSFSVIGPKAKTWDKYADRAFKGRDDGKLRAEIDASGAKLKWEDLRGRNVAAYRRIVDDWYKLPDEECKTITEYAELYYDWQDELAKLNSTSEEDAAYFEVYRDVAKLRSELNEKRGGVRKLLGKWFVERGGGAAVMMSANDALVDAVAASLWGPYVDYNVEDELDLQPLWHGGMALQDVLAYDELYKAYPELAQLRVETVKMEVARGRVVSSAGQHIIQINKNLEGEWAQFFSTLMHEVQHVIQDIEGFAKGGNPQSARDAAGNYKRRYEIQNESARLRQNIAWLEGYDVARREFLNIGDAISMREDKEKLQDLRDKYNNLAYQYNKGAIAEPGFNGEDGRDSSFVIPSLSGVTKGAYAKAQKAWDITQDRKAAFPGMLERLRARYDVLWAEFSELDKQQQRWGALSSHELYLRLAGEIEARNVQQRVRMTADERLAMPFNETLEYPGEALVTFSMERVTAEWQNTLDGYLQNPAKPGTPEHTRDLVVCPTPAVMQMVGAKGWDMVVTPGVLDKVMRGKHAVSVEALRQLPEALAAPVCIAVSDTPGCLEVITELKEGEHNVLVAVQLNSHQTNNVLVKVNRIASMYGKERIGALLNHPMLYWDKAKARPWLASYRLQLPAIIQPRRASGRRIQTPADLVKYKMQSGLSFSMERASLQALEVLRTRADEREGERLMNDWQKACEGWAQLHVGGDDSRLGNGAKMLGEIYALIGATKGVLPEKYARMGHLNGLLRWAAVYANMQQTGEVPAEGVIAGPIYEKFVERMRYIDKKNEAYGLNEAEVKEAMALLAGERLDVAMLKVARECKRRLEMFLKDRERERIDWVVERAYPKREKGKRSPRGKMDAETYRRMERAYRLMEMEANDVAGLMNRIKAALENMETAPADAVEVLRSLRGGDVPGVDEVEALEAELEDELFLAQTFGCWENMAFEQARRASGAMAELVLLGRSAWQSKLRAERRRAAFDRDEVSRHFGTKLEEVQAVRGDKTAKEKGRKRTSAKNLVMGSMSYSQLLVALEEKLGKRFTGRHMRMIAEAHESIMVENQRRHRWMYNTLRDITGLETEGEIEEWMQKNNEVFDTGIDLELPMKSTCRLTPEEAKMWLSLTAAERQKKREELVAEAAKKGEKPDNIPGEDVMAELEEKLVNAELNAAMPKEFVLTSEWSYKSRLRCTREALLYAILTFEQDDYEHLLEANGLTQGKLQQMRKLVGKELLRWGYAMRKELSEHGKMVAELYEAYTGVPFGQRQNYFRGVFDVARAKDAGEAVDQVSGVTGGKYGILIARQYHNQQLNWATSASAVFVATMKEQHNYIATAHITREWRTLLSDRLFERRVRAEIGDAALDMLTGWMKMIEGAALADVKVNAMMNNMLSKLAKAYAVSRLAGNAYTIMKQASALLNGFVGGYVPERVLAGNELVQELTYRHVGFGEYMAALGKAMAGKTEITLEEVEAAGFIAGRKNVEGSHVEEAALLSPWQSVPGKVGRKGRALYEANMDAIGFVDRKANAKAALAIAEVVYQQAKKENADGLVPDAELRRVAIETARMMVDRAAQPQLRTQKGFLAAGGGMFGALGNFFYMFKSETLNKLGLYVAQMMAGQHRAWLVGALSFGVMNSIILALIDWICGRWYDDDDEKWEKRAKSFAGNVLFNDISTVPLLGEVPDWVRGQLLGERYWASNSLVSWGTDTWKYGAREWKNIDEGASWDKHVTALCSLARSVGALGGMGLSGHNAAVGSCCELTLAAASLSNTVRFVKDVLKKVVGE
ncbi:MAG: hypothetical protein IKW19_00790 [Akkermansia sp.]|nr:hypothetical protein [Akkermansia sp.]MBR5184810.1 hypothetical protein [Akkermansia sp.]